MKITATNFRGIARAEIYAAPIALLCGHNKQGKSSIIEAIASCLGSVKQPYDLKKDEMDEMVHEGSDIAEVTIEDDGRQTTSRWPAGDTMATGRPFRATEYATGQILYSDLDTKARMKLLSQYLKTEPDLAGLTAAIQGMESPPLDEAGIKALWQNIQKLGWDGAHEDAKTEGTKLKGKWEQVTKARYGTKVGGTWRPQGWTSEHEAVKVETLTKERDDAKEKLEAAIGKVAINDDEKKRLEALTKNIPKLKQAVDERTQEVSQKAFVKTKAEGDIKKIPVIPKDNWPCCPHCKQPVQVMGTDQLRIPPAPMSAKQKKDLEEQLAQATTVFNKALAEWEEAVISLQTAQKDLRDAEGSKERLENSDPTAVSAEQIQEYRDEIARCESIIAVKQRIDVSLGIHIEIGRQISVVELLAPEGLRAKTLQAALEKFNAELVELADLAGWEHVSVQPDGSLRIHSTRMRLCSGGERMRADILMQIALGMRDGSEIFLVDEADVLDGEGRNGLFALLQHTGQAAVVAMMLLNKKAAPDLAAAGIGNTYWIQEANAAELAA